MHGGGMFGCDKAPVTNRGGEQHSMRHIKIMDKNSPILAYFNEKKPGIMHLTLSLWIKFVI